MRGFAIIRADMGRRVLRPYVFVLEFQLGGAGEAGEKGAAVEYVSNGIDQVMAGA